MNANFFGKRLKQARKALKITQIDLSEKIGIKQNFLSAVELGKSYLGLEKLLALTEVLQINYHWLLTGKGDMFRLTEEDGDMVAEPPGPPSQYDRAFDEALEDPDVQMLLGDISDIPKNRRTEALKQLRHTAEFWKKEGK